MRDSGQRKLTYSSQNHCTLHFVSVGAKPLSPRQGDRMIFVIKAVGDMRRSADRKSFVPALEFFSLRLKYPTRSPKIKYLTDHCTLSVLRQSHVQVHVLPENKRM